MGKKNILLFTTVIFTSAIIWGCSPTRYVIHDKGQLPSNEVSTLVTEYNIYVFKIDFERPKGFSGDCTGSVPSTYLTIHNLADAGCGSRENNLFELLPGYYIFSVYWAATHLDWLRGTGVEEISFAAEPGKNYVLKSNYGGFFGGFWTRVGSEVIFTVEEISPNPKIIKSIKSRVNVVAH